MEDINLTIAQLKKFLIFYQGFFTTPKSNSEDSVMQYIKRVGCIQFDPLDITGRNADLVLQARIPDYRIETLERLLYERRKLIDGWDKMMSIYPIEDWPYFHRKRKTAQEYLKNSDRGKPVNEVSSEVMKFIKKNGPSCSTDINFGRSTDWYWAPTSISRAALEGLFHAGKLSVHSKKKNRKYYDLTSNIIPEKIRTFKAVTADKEYHDWYVLRRIGNWGIFWNKPGDGWLSTVKTGERNSSIKRLLNTGKICNVKIENSSENFYIRKSDFSMLADFIDKNRSNEIKNDSAFRFIAPLDNFIWDRNYIQHVFEFTYRWEVYKPESERQFGYYVLPVLYENEFVARFEPRRDRKNSVLYIKNWWWEKQWSQSKINKNALENAIKNFCSFLDCTSVEIDDEIKKKGILKLDL